MHPKIKLYLLTSSLAITPIFASDSLPTDPSTSDHVSTTAAATESTNFPTYLIECIFRDLNSEVTNETPSHKLLSTIRKFKPRFSELTQEQQSGILHKIKDMQLSKPHKFLISHQLSITGCLLEPFKNDPQYRDILIQQYRCAVSDPLIYPKDRLEALFALHTLGIEITEEQIRLACPKSEIDYLVKKDLGKLIILMILSDRWDQNETIALINKNLEDTSFSGYFLLGLLEDPIFARNSRLLERFANVILSTDFYSAMDIHMSVRIAEYLIAQGVSHDLAAKICIKTANRPRHEKDASFWALNFIVTLNPESWRLVNEGMITNVSKIDGYTCGSSTPGAETVGKALKILGKLGRKTDLLQILKDYQKGLINAVNKARESDEEIVNRLKHVLTPLINLNFIDEAGTLIDRIGTNNNINIHIVIKLIKFLHEHNAQELLEQLCSKYTVNRSHLYQNCNLIADTLQELQLSELALHYKILALEARETTTRLVIETANQLISMNSKGKAVEVLEGLSTKSYLNEKATDFIEAAMLLINLGHSSKSVAVLEHAASLSDFTIEMFDSFISNALTSGLSAGDDAYKKLCILRDLKLLRSEFETLTPAAAASSE